MVRLKEVNVKARFSFAPASTEIATATIAGSLGDDLSDDATLDVYDILSTGEEGPKRSVKLESKCLSVSWGGASGDVVAVALEDNAVCFYDATTLAPLHKGPHPVALRHVRFNPIQKHLAVSAGGRGEFLVWDVPKGSSTAYRAPRLDDISAVAWNQRVGHILALGGKSGALSVWDLKNKKEIIHIATRYSVNAVAWHPSEATLLAVASGDDSNPVIQIWDLRNANQPKQTLQGHDKAILSLSWCKQDPELLLSGGADNRTLIWNPVSGSLLTELPISSQWVHDVAWCPLQPSFLANAALDGRLAAFSIQDLLAKPAEPAAAVEQVSGGDDFFDSIPRNFQAQTTSFSLPQPPRWLKRPLSARFGDGGRLVQFSATTGANVTINTYATTAGASDAAQQLDEALSGKSVAELCASLSEGADDVEQQEWKVIETLSSEKPRDSLVAYLGLAHANGDAAPKTTSTADASAKTDGPTEDGEDEFTRSMKQATIEDKGGAFSILGADISTTDRAITRAIMSGRFDEAIDVCLDEHRMSDAFMLALCGGVDAQARVRDAYFKSTKVPYRRLLSSIIGGDLSDLVDNAALDGWKEVLATLCKYAKPDDFSDLCTRLGDRLEGEDATVCFLAGAKLERLTKIWIAKQQRDEAADLKKADQVATQVHADGLAKLIKKVQVFRKAVSFADDKAKHGNDYALQSLYDRYVEFATLLVAEGQQTLARQYLALVPADYDAAKALQGRLQSATATAGRNVRPGSQNVNQRLPPLPIPGYGQAPNATTARPITQPSAYAPVAAAQPGYPAVAPTQQAYPPATQSQPQPSPYAPAQGASRPVTATSPYAPAGTPYQPAQPTLQQQYRQQGAPVRSTPYGPPQSNFAAPPAMTTGPTMLPAANRKDITPWNDAPELDPMPARRATPAVNARPGISTPFANSGAATPTFGQMAGAPPPTGLGPPPKGPAHGADHGAPPPRRPSTQVPPSAPFAPPQQQQQQQQQQQPMGYGQPPAPTGYPPQQQQQYNYPPQQPLGGGQPPAAFAPPPQSQPPIAAAPPPPKAAASFAPPPRGAPRTAASAGAGQVDTNVTSSPTIKSSSGGGGGFALSREPSRQGFQAPTSGQPMQTVLSHPSGDRDHIPQQDRPIFDLLSAELARVVAAAPEKYRRPLEDSERRLGVLFDRLNNALIGEPTLDKLRHISQLLGARDYAAAYRGNMELTQSSIDECRDWISGLKTLITVAKILG